MQFDRTVGRVRIVNAGSVGMPFGDPGAYWLLLGPAVQLRHTPYDLNRASERIGRPRPRAFGNLQKSRDCLTPPPNTAGGRWKTTAEAGIFRSV